MFSHEKSSTVLVKHMNLHNNTMLENTCSCNAHTHTHTHTHKHANTHTDSHTHNSTTNPAPETSHATNHHHHRRDSKRSVQTMACLRVWLIICMGCGSGQEYPTRVGPNTLARLLAGILVSTLSATLKHNTKYVCVTFSDITKHLGQVTDWHLGLHTLCHSET